MIKWLNNKLEMIIDQIKSKFEIQIVVLLSQFQPEQGTQEGCDFAYFDGYNGFEMENCARLQRLLRNSLEAIQIP